MLKIMRTEQEISDWYLAQNRVFTPDFLTNIQWDQATYDLSPDLVGVLTYMQRIEALTPDLFGVKLEMGPSGSDRHLRLFLKKWSEEEETHGQLFERYLQDGRSLGHFGYESYQKPQFSISQRLGNRTAGMAQYLVSPWFKALHMLWGTISELTTRLGYELLIHHMRDTEPFLVQLLKNIVKEESIHARYYMSMAEIKLDRSKSAQMFCRKIIEKVWFPVGADVLDLVGVAPLIRMFTGSTNFDRMVTSKIKELPGFANFDLTDLFETRIAPAMK